MNAKMPPTNKELAAKFGVSVRTVQRATRRDPQWWVLRRRELREYAARLRATGMAWADVGKALGVSPGAARALAKRGMGAWADTHLPPPDAASGDLFAAQG